MLPEQLPDAVVIPLVAIVFAAFGAIVQARATRSAAESTIKAQRVIAYDAALRQRRQAQLGDFVDQARDCVARYLTALGHSAATSISMMNAYTASMNYLETITLIPPLKLDDERLREAVKSFVGLELRERAEVLATHHLMGSESHQEQKTALGRAARLLEAAFLELDAAAEAYVFGERPKDTRHWRYWLPWDRHEK